MLMRVIYHYWYHTGESAAVRQILGHVDLPEFVGDMDVPPTDQRQESPRAATVRPDQGQLPSAAMIDSARIDAGGGAYRGFLFSDLRGFTAFSERYGNTAAAAKVNRFLEITRRAIARHEGAEIKTEGDAIHAVFPSASSAVLCGLEIADAEGELNAEEPQRRLGMGVGVHAGEAVETAEGYIGRAVNIAARLCAAAKPGEVLVSSTVKGITQASIPVGFIPRGKRRLKGIQDPIVVYAVTRDMTARAPREVPRSRDVALQA